MSREIQQPTHDNRCFHRVISATRSASQVDYKIFPTPHHLTHHHHTTITPAPTAPHNEHTHRHTHRHTHTTSTNPGPVSSLYTEHLRVHGPWAIACLANCSHQAQSWKWRRGSLTLLSPSHFPSSPYVSGRRSTALASSTHNKRRTLITITNIQTIRPAHEVTLPEIVTPFILQDLWICMPQPTMTLQRV